MRLAIGFVLISVSIAGFWLGGCSSSADSSGVGNGAAGAGGKDGGAAAAAAAERSNGSAATGGRRRRRTSGTGGAAGSAGTGGSGGCTSDGDCSAPTAVCDTATSTCVECLPSKDSCPTGQYCTKNNGCAAGCSDSTDCSGTTTKCDTTTNQCVECLTDPDCSAGQICVQHACAQGCSASQPCVNTAETCCTSSCHDLQTDPTNCGTCGNTCPTPLNAQAVCNTGACGMGACSAGFLDCNKSATDGCEINSAVITCVCTPGAVQNCYTGPTGTENKGVCKAGTQTCDASGLQWGPCLNQVVPSAEICANGIDEDCTGTADDVGDVDGDGWTKCNGDCCETPAECSDPKLVNPGAFEFAGNNLDDDCDGTKDNALTGCDAGLASSSATGLDYAKAIDLCQTTTETPPLNQKKWGVISANFYLANAAGTPSANARSIRPGFGNNVLPKLGQRLAVLSTGRAAAQAAPNNASPAWAAFQGGQNNGTSSAVPADWLAANGGNFPNAPGCPDPQGGTTANDPIMLKLRVRVPTNAKSFTLSSYFYSSEYPEWVCSPFNDFFLTLLDSTFVPGPGETANPTDKNLAFYDPAPVGAPFYPLGVNLAFGNTGLFKACKNGPTGCGGGSVAGTTNTCTATTELTGTGFDIANPPSQFINDPGWCGTSNFAGGGTGWLNVAGNVKPGETVEIRFVLWDTGDPWYDSLVLLDNFVW
ncbi:MAG: MopE-related protein, partial [Polyangiaceae bacterium]